jgi:NAD(P)-dependent dehydrogenase (short-subunit alcohol dehydrogenase family)
MPTVLVTGAARGIGRAAATTLAGRGWDVIAGVRRAEDGEALAAESPRIRHVLLDVTDAEQLAALPGALPERLEGLVNNAGIAVTGPIEGLPLHLLRHQLEVNVVGQAAVTQAALPALRKAKGRIVFVSSLSGRIAQPLFGAYNASKFALEGMADAMRCELHPWGIRVSLVEPAQTDTDMWRNASDQFDRDVEALTPEGRELYAQHLAGARKMIPRAQKMASPVEGVVGAIEKALTSERPRARYVVGALPRVQSVIAGITPTRMLDASLRKVQGVPRQL